MCVYMYLYVHPCTQIHINFSLCKDMRMYSPGPACFNENVSRLVSVICMSGQAGYVCICIKIHATKCTVSTYELIVQGSWKARWSRPRALAIYVAPSNTKQCM